LTRAALAPIEKKMVRMLAHGISPRIIANRLALSESSLRACLDSVFAKLAISGQLGLLTSAEDRNRRSSFSLVRLAHRLAKKNSDRENDMQVA
jgi:DNA-binding CsgD family transcriptional regulator